MDINYWMRLFDAEISDIIAEYVIQIKNGSVKPSFVKSNITLFPSVKMLMLFWIASGQWCPSLTRSKIPQKSLENTVFIGTDFALFRFSFFLLILENSQISMNFCSISQIMSCRSLRCLKIHVKPDRNFEDYSKNARWVQFLKNIL